MRNRSTAVTPLRMLSIFCFFLLLFVFFFFRKLCNGKRRIMHYSLDAFIWMRCWCDLPNWWAPICRLTKMWTQCVQMIPTTSVPMAPNRRPAFLNAIGIAKIPVPRELFSKWASEPEVLIWLKWFAMRKSNVISIELKSKLTNSGCRHFCARMGCTPPHWRPFPFPSIVFCVKLIKNCFKKFAPFRQMAGVIVPGCACHWRWFVSQSIWYAVNRNAGTKWDYEREHGFRRS